MKGYTDIVILLVYAWAAFTTLTKKEALGKKKQDLYTKESREKLASVMGWVYIVMGVICAFYCLCNHGIINLYINEWVFLTIILVGGIAAVAILEKTILVKVAGSSASGKSGKKDDSEDEDF